MATVYQERTKMGSVLFSVFAYGMTSQIRKYVLDLLIEVANATRSVSRLTKHDCSHLNSFPTNFINLLTDRYQN